MLKNIQDFKLQMSGKNAKLAIYAYNHLNRSKEEIVKELGVPEHYSDHTILFYNISRYIFFRDEISFSLRDGKVSEIGITQYFMGFGINDIIYRENGPLKYSSVSLISSKVFRY